ncbi:MAG: hypothetical protein ACW99G_01265 [Candidatus Thorarchaeota archaeon]|jgi:hypothetical protein
MAIILGISSLSGSAQMQAIGCTINYCYTMSGGITMGGCAVTTSAKCVTYKFAEDSLVYICEKAFDEGKLEAVKIKRVDLIANFSTFGNIVPIYTDTLNGRWEEHELCSQQTAVEAAKLYYEAQLADAQDLIDSLC